jgi:para-nitrobenzyl esterase
VSTYMYTGPRITMKTVATAAGVTFATFAAVTLSVGVGVAQGVVADNTVTTQQGQLTCTSVTKNSNACYNVPYATPPVGHLRWRPPTSPSSYTSNPRDATTVGNACIQGTASGPSPGYSEDCL